VTFIGGFFGLELPPVNPNGLASIWGVPARSSLTYANARSALAALLTSIRPNTLWLPAYICRSVAQAAEATATPVRYFAVDESLQPDTSALQSAVRPGDMVLAVDYFGRPPGCAFLDFVARRPDLVFVEDACHAADTGVTQWGRWCLRSPRKLVGVPDGGFIVPSAGISEANGSESRPVLDAYEAAFLRFEDEEECCNPRWHDANQRREATEPVSPRRMSRLTRELLERLALGPIADKRHANFRVLADMLDRYKYLPDKDPGFVPLGFPIRLRAALRDKVLTDLIAQGLFPAVHWSDLPSPAAFTTAHGLATELLTLPCDQRYEPIEMERIARVLRETLKRQ
jgi:dTDP-4-amino-4,6-dideoxygalactose transaminase